MPAAQRLPTNPWQAQLARAIDQRLATLAAAQAHRREQLRRLARERALHSLGLAEVQAERQAIAALRRDLDRRAQQAHRALLALVRRVPLDAVAGLRCHGLHPEVRAALRQRQREHEEELLREQDWGRELLRWRRERDELPTTVALALASRPGKAFWQKALALLGEEPTPLQQQALALEAGAAVEAPG